MEKLILYVLILLTGYAYVVEPTTSCRIEYQITPCNYTVVCENHAGSAPNINCNHEPNVHFQLTKSNVSVLYAGFFGSTNFDSRVRSFSAINNHWNSIAPSALRYYSKTIKMNLSGNKIQDIQDEAFKNLLTLKTLNLSSNLIETLHTKSLLTTDMKGSEIEILDLSNNLLETISSKTFYQCPALQELYLENNNLASLEDVFSNLQNLTLLCLQNNKLTGLSASLINLKGLKYLDVSHNAIKKLSGYETNRLISLVRVNMSFNEMEYIESNCFNQAFNLESLDLRNNKIKSTIVNIMFLNNAKLSYLNLYNNSITRIQENAFQHNSIIYINLENNFLSGEITDTTFAGLQGVRNLSLCKQNITSIKAKGFSEMSNLENLNLSFNKINFIDQSSFKNTSLLTIMDLGHNNIYSLSFLKDALANLTEMYLNNNNITNIPASSFLSQTLLKKLDISMNKILTIEQFSLPLNKLQFLNVSGNILTGSVTSNVFSPAQYLRYLDLSNLNISRVENMAFINLPVLARLNLSHNAIEFVGSKNFFNLSNVFSLDLSNNRLLNLQLNGSNMDNLNALYLNNNNLSNVFGIIPNSTVIMYLDLSYNNISVLTGAAFATLKQLRVLKASNNKIRKFNNPQMNLLSKLKDIDLSSNLISDIDVTYYKDLVRLDVSNNIVNYVNSSLLQVNHLQVLNMCNNNISVLSPGVFTNAESLKVLNISHNKLTMFRYGSLKGLHNTEVIDLSKNNVTEIDVDVFHECKELKTLIMDYNHINYLDIEQLINNVPKLTSLSIGGNPIDCKQIVRDIRNMNKTANRSVEITSIDKIFHEDNVYGIRCGDTDSTTTAVTPISSSIRPLSGSPTIIIWCSVLTVVFILLGVFLIWKRLFKSVGSTSETRMQFGRSVELNGSDFQSDLLN